MDNNTHYFWAISLSDDVKETVYGKFEKLNESFPYKRWVHEFDYHITLTFLGLHRTKN